MRLPLATALLAIASACYAARLDNSYIPPDGARSAGGAGLIRPPGGGGGNLVNGPSGFGLGRGDGGGGGVYPGGAGGPQSGSGGQEIPIISYSSENTGDGNYQFSYETGNGIAVQETGYQQGESESVSGSFSYTGPDGLQYSITYTADEHGFHPQGAHLPTPPPIPPEIQRGIELALAAEARGENQGNDGHSQGGNGYLNADSRGSHGGGNRDAYQGPNSYRTSSSGGYQY